VRRRRGRHEHPRYTKPCLAPNLSHDAPGSDFNGYYFRPVKLNEFGGDHRHAEMVKAFISSLVYRQRFSQ
jgi:hypothetical protein